jgi:hypothetical protein
MMTQRGAIIQDHFDEIAASLLKEYSGAVKTMGHTTTVNLRDMD